MKYKILELLKQNNDFISGQEIANIFNVSRTAVWKNIIRLKDEGYNIVSVSNKGYRLIEETDVLNEGEIKHRPLKYIPTVESTNNEAKSLAAEGCPEGLLVVCDEQTAGKGRLGRTWISEKSSGLYMSIVLRPDIMPFEAPQLTLIAGIACAKAINNITGLDCKIKWPNDIVSQGKKLVGILTEMAAEMESVKYVVVGIGININNQYFDDEIRDKASSIYIQTGKKYKRAEIADGVMTEFMRLYNIYQDNGFKAFTDLYNSLCINIGREVKTIGKTEITGKALGVNSKGELIIQTDSGVEAILSGEVSLRLRDNTYI